MNSVSPGLVAVRRRIRIALLANVAARVVRTAEQLILVPLLLASWGVQSYGEWLALAALAGFAPLANLGIGHAASAEIVLKSARGELGKAASIVVTSLAASAASVFLGTLIFWLVIELIDLKTILGLASVDGTVQLIILMLAGAGVLTSLCEPLAGALSAVHGAGLPSALAALSKTLELVAIAFALSKGATPPLVAAIMLASAGLNVMLHLLSTAWSVPWASFSPARIDIAAIVRIWRPAAGFFMIFACLNVLSVYLPRILVSHTLGPVALASFGVLVTYTRTARNFATMTSQATQVEIGRLWGKGDLAGARQITARMLRHASAIAAILLVGALALAPVIIPRWTQGHIGLDWRLMASLALVALLGSYFDGVLIAVAALNRVTEAASGYAAGLAVALGGAMLLVASTGQLWTIGLCLLLPELGGTLLGRRTLRALAAPK